MNTRKARSSMRQYTWQRYRVEDQPTQRLALGNLAFRAYLYAHNLSSLDVALVSGVRYLTLWNIEHDIPILATHADSVRIGLQRMTGSAYTGPIAVHTDERGDHDALRAARQ